MTQSREGGGIEAYEKGPNIQQQQLGIGGLVAFGLGVYWVLQKSGVEWPPFIMIAVAAMLVVVLFGAMAAFKAKGV